MQAAQRKTEYRPTPTSSGKRIVKKDGNVAYIRTGSPKSTALRNKPGAQRNTEYNSRNTAAPRNTLGVKHPVRVGGGQIAKPAANRVVHGGASAKSSVIVSANAAAKQTLRKAAPKQARRAHVGAVSTIIVAFVAFCALSLLISRYASIAAIGLENDKLKSSVNDLQVKIEELKVDMEMQDNLENVRDTALNVLKMTYPDQSQKVYLDTN